MKKPIIAVLISTHIFIGFIGFALGIYALPILTAPSSPTTSDLTALTSKPGYTEEYTAEFIRDLKDSDFLHWGEGKISLSKYSVTFIGELAAGPDYILYLSPEFVETETEFERLKSSMYAIGDVNTFKNFMVVSDEPLALDQYNTVIVWCESFGEFITAAKYR